MLLSEFKQHLSTLETVDFLTPNGEQVPSHFHVTEVGQIDKKFIDCGGTIRTESVINFQLWTSDDFDHRLGAETLKSIIALSEKELKLDNVEIEVEYQSNTIGKYHLSFFNGQFQLVNTKTDCLAKEHCGLPTSKPKQALADLTSNENTCTPGSGCC